jgi:prepilin-type N-terminal cleavage/methylation domain-containing protein
MKRRGFTIIEMLVAIGLLTALLAGSAVIFSVSVQAQRTAKATSEISRRLRAITDQLNADFAGLQKDAPLAIWFEYDSNTQNRHDQILFFADGDFQTTHQYNNGTISGNVARIYYGQAHEIDYATRDIKQIYKDIDEDPEDGLIDIKGVKLLARRQHVLTGDEGLPVFPDTTDFEESFSPADNDFFEYDTMSLVGWEGMLNSSDHRDQFLSICFDNGINLTNGQLMGISGRPGVDFKEIRTLHMVMLEGVGSFEIQWWGWDVAMSQWRWWPSSDLDDKGDLSYPEFKVWGLVFGRYFNMAGGVNLANWAGLPTLPRALKFTFTLYDSLGIYEDGKRFTHIVYLDD